jgi:hypothetical protein
VTETIWISQLGNFTLRADLTLAFDDEDLSNNSAAFTTRVEKRRAVGWSAN